MGLLEFDKLPINTLVGADWKTFKAVTANKTIDKGFRNKYFLTKSVCRLLSLLQPFENARYRKIADKPLEMDPVFILGHWRSGTTFMHNVFSCDKHFGYNTTYQTVFLKLIKISLWNTNGTQFLSKNPPHTGRVKTLVEMFPNAKFIYLKRNPYTVFESTRSFFTNTIQPLRLQEISNEQIESNFIEVYRRLFYKYEEQKHLIPEGNLVEVKFEDFEQDAFAMTEDIYKKLNLPGFEESKAEIEKYLGKKKGYKKNQYKYDDRTVQLVEENWGMALKEWGYSL